MADEKTSVQMTAVEALRSPLALLGPDVIDEITMRLSFVKATVDVAGHLDIESDLESGSLRDSMYGVCHHIDVIRDLVLAMHDQLKGKTREGTNNG